MVEFLPKTSNFMRKIVWHGCARPWYVYAETFFPAFIDLFITVAILDLDDIIRNRGDRLAGEGSRRTRRGMGHVTRARTSAQAIERERFAARGLKVVLKVTKPLEPIGFTFLLVNATDEFFFDWQALIERAPFCEQPIETGPFSRTEPAGRQGILPGGAAVNLDILEQNRAGWSSNAFAVAVPGGLYQFIFMISVAGTSGGHPGAKARITVTGGIGGNEFESEETPLEEGVFTDLIVDAEFFVSTLDVASITWELVGAAVPVGLPLASASVVGFRVG